MESTETNDVVTGINVTPLVDIILVLLIIFMATAHFVSDSGIKVNLPQATTTEASATSSVVVTIDEKGTLFLIDREMDLENLKKNLKQEATLNPGIRVTLAADEKLPYRHVVHALDTIKQAGVVRVALASER